MERHEIESEVRRHDTTVLSFPNRGPWGSSKYRGNCSGWIPAYFIWKYGVERVAEVFAGSGTTSDVCRDMGVDYVGIDINPNPPRDNIIAMDILDDTRDLPDGFYNADLAFLHPPYPSIHGIRYAGVMWEANAKIKSHDIQSMPWEDGMKAVNHAVLRAYNALPPGAYEAVLVGEIRSKGQYRSMKQNLAVPGILHQIYVKLQHNTMSGRKIYNTKREFALTQHEMIAVYKKPSGYEIAYVVPRSVRLDIRDSWMATWKDVIISVVRRFDGSFTNDMVYSEVENHKKAMENPHWREKCRQVLQCLANSGLLLHTGRGIWQTAV